MPISDRQTTSVGLKRAGDPDGLNRVAGLELGLRAANSAWPVLTCRGGVQAFQSRLVTVGETSPGGWEPQTFRTIGPTDLGTISKPSDTAGAITETSGWDHVKLSYASDFDVTLSRISPAMLLETSATSLRLCGGTVTKRTTNGTTITETASQDILPKYVGYHTSGGYQVGTLSGSSTPLTGMDQPWLLVWFGDQSHWVDTTRPLFYGSNSGIYGTEGHPESDAFQADCPLLIVFSDNPTAIVQTSGQGGFDLTFSSGAKKMSIMPLYGRERLASSVTNAWTTGASLPQPEIATWYPRLQEFPASVAETYAYNSGSDTATITETFSWTQVRSGGTKFALLPPVLGTARDTDLTVTVDQTVIDTSVATEYGPIQGVASPTADAYSWSITGLATYTAARPPAGGGAVPSTLQARLDAEVDRLIAGNHHWQPWIMSTRMPNPNMGGDVYFSNQADTLALAAEAAPTVTGSRRSDLLDWMRTEQAAYPAQTTYAVSATAGTARGPLGVPGSHAAITTSNSAYDGVYYSSRQWIWAAWGLARHYQETGDAIPSGLVTTLVAILDADMAEQDWATSYWLAGYEDRLTAVENANRHVAGLLGLAWLAAEDGHSDEDQIRALLAKAAVTRVALAHLPRWLYSAGLLTYPTADDWDIDRRTHWTGTVFTETFNDADDDPRVVTLLNQFEAYLADSTALQRTWLGRTTRANVPAYRSFTKPVADLLAAFVPGEAEIYAVKHRETPHWWVPFQEANVGQEANVSQPADSYGMFLAKAWLEDGDPDELSREAAYPWLDSGGDLFTVHKLAEAARAFAGDDLGVVTEISDSGTVAKRETFEVTFQVASDAINTYPPYDATYNTDGQDHQVEFSDDSFATYVTRPAFWETVYDHTTHSSKDWYAPNGTTHWTARFSPPRDGAWEYRIRTRDADGTSLSAAQAFTVTTSIHKGRVQVAPADARYFEYEDGSFFFPRGYNQTYETLPFSTPDIDGANWATSHADNGVNLVRLWLTWWAGTSTEGSLWTNTRSDADRSPYVNPSGQPLLTPYGTHQMASYVAANYSITAWDWNKPAVNVKESTTYRVRLRYQLPDASLTASNGALPYGLTFKTSQTWIINYTTEPEEPDKGTAHITPVHAQTGDGTAWAEATGTFTTRAGQWFLDQAFIVLQNCSAGIAFVDHIWIEEDIGGGEYGPNIVGQPSFGAPNDNVNGEWMRRFYDFLGHIEATDLKLVLTTNPRAADFFLGWMEDDGSLGSGVLDDDRWAGDDGSKQRFYHQAWAREVMARFGHSPSLFSMEFNNEQSPGNARHWAAAEDYCAYLTSLGDAPMVSTSNSSTLPRATWDAIPSASYIDLHCYQDDAANTDITVYDTDNTRVHAVADWLDSAAWIDRVNDTCGVAQSTLADVRPVRLGEGAMYLSGDPVGAAPSLIAVSEAVAATYLRKRLWAGLFNPGGVADNGEWLPAETIYPSFDVRALFGVAGGVVETVPLNEGGYVDIDATCPTGLRAWGQKNTLTGSALIWVDNQENTWKQTSDASSVTPRSGDVTFAIPAGDYTVTPYDTTTGAAGTPSTIASSGTLALPISSLSSDVAYLIEIPSSSVAEADSGTFVMDGLGLGSFIVDGFGGTSEPPILATGGSFVVDGFGFSAMVTDGFGRTTDPPITADAGSFVVDGFGTLSLVIDGFSPVGTAAYTGTGDATAASTASATGFVQRFGAATETATATGSATGLRQTIGTATATATATAAVTVLPQVFGTGSATAQASAHATGTGGTTADVRQKTGRLRFSILARLRI